MLKKGSKKRGSGTRAPKKNPDVFDELIESVNKKLKRKALVMGHSIAEIPGFLPTGNMLLDMLCGGGIPQGRVSEIYGAESVGKSTMAGQLIASCQQMGGFVTVIDSEAGMTRESVERCGADYSKIVWHESYLVEDGFEVITALVRKYKGLTGVKPPLLVIWDTIAASPTEKEYDEGAGLADKARVISLALRRLTQDIAEEGIALVLMNQVREKIGARGEIEFSPGGRAIKFHASLRLKADRAQTLKHGDHEFGHVVRWTVKKMKYGRPRGQLEVPLVWDRGMDDFRTMLRWLLDDERSGASKNGGSGVYMSGAYIKVELPRLKKPLAFFDKKFEEKLDDPKVGKRLREFLHERVVELGEGS